MNKRKETTNLGNQFQASIPSKSISINDETKDKSILLWDCKRLAEKDVELYTKIAKKVWPSKYKYDEFAALRLLTALDYSLQNAIKAMSQHAFMLSFIERLNYLDSQTDECH